MNWSLLREIVVFDHFGGGVAFVTNVKLILMSVSEEESKIKYH